MKKFLSIMLVAGLLLAFSNTQARRSPDKLQTKSITHKRIVFDRLSWTATVMEDDKVVEVDLSGGGTNPCTAGSSYMYDTMTGLYYCCNWSMSGPIQCIQAPPPYGGPCGNC